MGVTFRDVVLRAAAFFAVTVDFAKAFVAAFFTPADFLDATAFLAPTFLLAARTFGAVVDALTLRVAARPMWRAKLLQSETWFGPWPRLAI